MSVAEALKVAGEIRRTVIQECAEACDHWSEQEYTLLITGPEADITMRREREDAFRDAAKRLRESASR